MHRLVDLEKPMRQRRHTRLALALGFLAYFDGSGGHAQMMAVPGKLEVTQQGAASYTIPIAVPPGTVGMAPTLTLSYNSQQGDGSLGIGWSFTGLPAIFRCPQTVAQDGISGAVNYDANDRFCLDGQRLMAVSGNYGADGTEYRTEAEGFAKIVSHGTAGTGPAWFEVHTKTGQIMEFGRTADSQVVVQGKASVRFWSANKVSDTKDNYLTASYTIDAANGQSYLSRIDYTGNASTGLTPYNSVRVMYETRTDATPFYLAGSLIKMSQRISAIESYAGSTRVNRYQFTYEYSPSTQRSRIKSVTQCGQSGVCLPPTTFTWTDSIPGTFTQTTATLPNYMSQFPLDYNGDGKTDIFMCVTDQYGHCSNGAGGSWAILWNSRGDGTFSVVDLSSKMSNSASPLFGDFNGDGKSDIFMCVNDQYGRCNLTSAKLWISNGDGTFNSTSLSATMPNNMKPFLGNFSGRGRTDIFWCAIDEHGRCSPGASQPTAKLWLSNGDGTFTESDLSTIVPNAMMPFLGDFSGRGQTDIFWCVTDQHGRCTPSTGSPSAKLWLSKGDGTFAASDLSSIMPSYMVPTLLDVNGDGKADVFWCTVDQYRRCSTGAGLPYAKLWTSRGDGTFVVSDPSSLITNGQTLFPADFSGDGKGDIFWCVTDASFRCSGGGGPPSAARWISAGDGGFSITDTSSSLPSNMAPLFGDFNGDGKPDLLWCNKDIYGRCTASGANPLWLSDRVPVDLITTANNGLGATTSLTYKPLTDSAVYAKGSGAVYPTQDSQVPLHVVSQSDASDGVGGRYKTAYSYAGLQMNAWGRGSLGFASMTTKDLQTNVVETTTYRQDYPYTGLPSVKSKSINGTVLNQDTMTYTATSLGGTRYFVAPTAVVSASTDLSGAAMPTITTTTQYDGFGNPTQIKVSTPDGASRTTTNTYSNDPAKWLLGRLTRASVTSVVP